MRAFTAPALAALASSPVPMAPLVEMDLTAALTLNTSPLDLTIASTVYLGTGGLGKISAIEESPSEIKQLQFELSGVPSASIALALSEPVQGKAVRIKICIFDPTTYQALDTRLRWAGMLDVMSIDDGKDSATITVTAEHAGIDLLRPNTSLYSDIEQQRLHPGDLFFQYVTDQADMRIIWPAASYGRQ